MHINVQVFVQVLFSFLLNRYIQVKLLGSVFLTILCVSSTNYVLLIRKLSFRGVKPLAQCHRAN